MQTNPGNMKIIYERCQVLYNDASVAEAFSKNKLTTKLQLETMKLVF